MKLFISEYLKAIYKPRKVLEELIVRDDLIKYGFIYMAIPIAAYTLMYIFLTIGHGAPSVFTPWLNIPKESYYAVNRFLLLPSMLICWFTATSFIQISSRGLGGVGTFEQTLVCIALSISIAMWGALIHDLPMSFMSAIGVIDAKQHEIDMNSPTIFRTLLWICYSVYFLAFFILFTLSVKVVHKLGWLTSFGIGSLAFIIFQLIFLIFNR
jgi:Yip1 domain